MAAPMPVYAPNVTTAAVPLFSNDHHQMMTPFHSHSHSPYTQHYHSAATAMNVTVGNNNAARTNNANQQQHMRNNANMMMQQQQQMMMLNAAQLQQQQQMMMMNAMPTAATCVASSSTTKNNGRSSRSPTNANGAGNGQQQQRQPSTPFNPAAAMPLEDMITAYNNVKAREIELQAVYADEVAMAAAAGIAPPNAYVSPFVDYACSQQGKLVLQGLLHFEDEVAVAQDLFTSVNGHIDTIALNEHGCHVVRALGEKIGFAAAVVENEDGSINTAAAEAQNEASLIQFINSFHETLFLNVCTLSQESRRIPQALFETYNATKPELFTNLVDIVARNVLYLSATQQGCIAFMRVYEASNFHQKRQMAANLVKIIADLSCDSFGNYVVQCLVEHSEVHVAAQYISSAFVGQCVRLACNKFASNVMEKSIRKLSHIPSVRRVILDELVFDPANVTICCEDSFANFVVQTLIETSANAAEFRKIHDRVKGAIANSMYAAKIEARLRSKSFFAHVNLTANTNSNSAAVTSQHTAAAPVAPVSAAAHSSNHHSENTPVMQAMMAAAAAAAARMQKQHSSSTVESSNSVATNNNGPVYNADTAPSTPTATPAANSNNNHHHTKKHGKDVLPVDAAIVTGAPKRGMGASNNNKPHQQQRNNKENNSNGKHSSSAPAAKKAEASAPAAVDPLQAEAKRLLNSDKPPTNFTPYKPSPFHDRSNRQNNANNTNSSSNNNASSCGPASKNAHHHSAERKNASSSAPSSNSNSNNASPRSAGGSASRRNRNNNHNRAEQMAH